MSPYLALLNQFAAKDALYHFNDKATTLYSYLLRLANSGRWGTMTIEVKDEALRAKYGWGRDALADARTRLVAARLVVFTQGNGRGNPARYEIIMLGKGAEISTLSPAKGALKTDPLFTDEEIKVLVKVHLDRHLYAPEPAPSAGSEPPKIEDTLKGSKEPFALTDASAQDEPVFKEKKSASKSKKKPAAPPTILTNSRLAYEAWVKRRTATDDSPGGVPAKIDGAQINALKSIIQYIRTQVTYRAEQRKETITAEQQEARILEAWNHILSNTHLLGEWLGSRTRLVDFNSEFQNIYIRVRDEILATNQRTKQQQQSAGHQRTSSNNRPGDRKGHGGAGDLQSLKFD